jgi:peptide/nickel transport system permease protein
VLLWAVSLLSFLALELAPGDFFDGLALNPRIRPETLDGLRAQHGLDRPVTERYLHWISSLTRGEMGFSFAYNAPVGPLLWERGINTLLLTTTALAATWLLAVPLGIFWASRRGWVAETTAAAGSAILAMPDLVIALGLLALAAETGWLPPGGMASAGPVRGGLIERALDVARHLILPASALVITALPAVARHVRSAMTEVLDEPYVRAARIHGIGERRVLFRHALPAASNPLISLFGLSIAGLLSSSLVVEVVLGWPGLGPLMLEAILARDYYLVLGPVMAGTLLLIAGNLLADVLLYAVDPRTRGEVR